MAGVTISTHVLDTERGRPAAGVRVELYAPDGSLAGEGTTDADGRIATLGAGPGGATLATPRVDDPTSLTAVRVPLLPGGIFRNAADIYPQTEKHANGGMAPWTGR